MNRLSVILLTFTVSTCLRATPLAASESLSVLNAQHSLVLVPFISDDARKRRSVVDDVRKGRSVDDDVDKNDKQSQRKYQRLAHSVQIQSEIKYR
jgi:hypothetical protein